MNQYTLKVAGVLMLIASVVILLMAPPPEQFSIANFYAFLAFLVCGFLLVSGYVGAHPRAFQLRREAGQTGTTRPGPLCHVPEQVFSYTKHTWDQKLATSFCVILGFFQLALGSYLVWMFPETFMVRVLIGLPLWGGGIISIWFPLRHLRMFVKVAPEGISARLYFRTAVLRWEEVVALISREHFFVISLGLVFSVYSKHTRIEFTNTLPSADQLTSIIAQATGLTWQ